MAPRTPSAGARSGTEARRTTERRAGRTRNGGQARRARERRRAGGASEGEGQGRRARGRWLEHAPPAPGAERRAACPPERPPCAVPARSGASVPPGVEWFAVPQWSGARPPREAAKFIPCLFRWLINPSIYNFIFLCINYDVIFMLATTISYRIALRLCAPLETIYMFIHVN